MIPNETTYWDSRWSLDGMSNRVVEGEVRVAWEPPDLLVLSYRGNITGLAMQRGVEEAHRFVTKLPYHIALLEVSQLSSMTPDARKIAVASSDMANIRGAAIIGASYHLRVLGTLLIRASRLIYKNNNPTEFFDSEERARRWLQERHEALVKEYSSAK